MQNSFSDILLHYKLFKFFYLSIIYIYILFIRLPLFLQPTAQAASAPPAKSTENFGSSQAPRGGSQEGLPQREPRRSGRGPGNWARRGPDTSEGDRSRGGGPGRMYPDKCQLFVGNLPQDIKDDELKEFFSSKYLTNNSVGHRDYNQAH